MGSPGGTRALFGLGEDLEGVAVVCLPDTSRGERERLCRDTFQPMTGRVPRGMPIGVLPISVLPPFHLEAGRAFLGLPSYQR